MTLLGQSQGRGYASTDARVPALNVRSSHLTCTNPVRAAGITASADHFASDSWKTASIFDDCPMCGQQPVEPVRVEGQLACRSCTSACTICGSACVPGDDACIECVRLFSVERAAVPA
ncbi:hypothetical protein Mycsm_07131 (plasmid) [Mycobacterium sp. JS623]|nr:hypothetical protein Mycsm_07131 [Mycobacterium sp. JS623]